MIKEIVFYWFCLLGMAVTAFFTYMFIKEFPDAYRKKKKEMKEK